jgi:hypothetical protein
VVQGNPVRPLPSCSGETCFVFPALSGCLPNGASRETNFLANRLTSIQKSRRFFANLASESIAAVKLLAHQLSESARRNEEPRENRGQLRCCIWIQVFGCQSLRNRRRRRKQGFKPGVRIFIRCRSHSYRPRQAMRKNFFAKKKNERGRVIRPGRSPEHLQ